MAVTLPTVGGSAGAWGTTLNAAFDEILNAARTAVEYPVYDKGGQIWSARAHGITPGGSAQTTAINNLIDTITAAGGGTLYFDPSDDPYITGTIVPKANVTLAGAGMGRSVLQLANAANASVITNASGNIDNFAVRDLTIDANGANQTSGGHGIELATHTNTLIQGVEVKNTRDCGILAITNTGLIVDGCRFSAIGTGSAATDGGKSAIALLSGGIDCRISGNEINDPKGMGIFLGNGSGGFGKRVRVYGNHVAGAGFIGIAAGGDSFDYTIVGNTVEGCTDNGIDTGAVDYLTCAGNTVDNCGSGIVMDGGNWQTFLGNTIRATTATDLLAAGIGLWIANGKACAALGNIIDRANHHGIALASLLNSTCIGNVVSNSSQGTAGQIGIAITGTNDGLIVTGNRAFDDQGTKTQDYGVYILSGTTNLTLINNDVRGNLTGGMVIDGSTTGIFRDNPGHVLPGDTFVGSGSPEGVVTAPVGALYRRTDGGAGTTLYVKSSGTGNTGWSALS